MYFSSFQMSYFQYFTKAPKIALFCRLSAHYVKPFCLCPCVGKRISPAETCSVGLIFICPAAVKRRDVILPLRCEDYFTVLTMPSQEEMPMVLR